MNKQNFNKGTYNVRKYKKEELKNAITELKNILNGFNSRPDEREERLSDLEDRAVELTQSDGCRYKLLVLSSW